MYKKTNFRSPWIALAGILCVLLGTIRHSWVLYMDTTGQTSPSLGTMIYVAFMLLALDAAVVIFAIHGNERAAQTFAWLIGTVNLYYFWSHLAMPERLLDWLGLLPGLLYAGMFSYALYFFTEIFVGYIERDEDLVRAEAERDRYRAEAQQAEKARKEAEDLAAARLSEVETSEAYTDLERRYEAALELVAEARGLAEKSPANLRATRSHYAKKSENNPEAQVVIDALDRVKPQRKMVEIFGDV